MVVATVSMRQNLIAVLSRSKIFHQENDEKSRLGEVIFWFKNLNLERLFAEDRLGAAYNARNRAALQEASAACSTGVSGGNKTKKNKKRNP